MPQQFQFLVTQAFYCVSRKLKRQLKSLHMYIKWLKLTMKYKVLTFPKGLRLKSTFPNASNLILPQREKHREMEEQRQRHQRIVPVPCPFQGHVNPMLQLGSILHSKGFPITIAHTQFNFPNTLNHPNFNFLPIVDGFSNCNVSSVNFIDVISGFNSNCKAPLQELMA